MRGLDDRRLPAARKGSRGEPAGFGAIAVGIDWTLGEAVRGCTRAVVLVHVSRLG